MHKIFIILGLMVTSSSPALAANCPDSSLAETQEDCPWAGIARALSEQGKLGAIDLIAALKDSAPELAAEISRDSHATQYKTLWGKSINFDELAKGIIIDPAILKALAKAFHVHYISDRLSHAGMEHTYGYLFSNLKTAFGYKRARWVHGDTERGFGLTVGTLGPEAPKVSGGSLFSNATYFFGRIAFRDDAKLIRVLEKHAGGVAKSLRHFDYSILKPSRLEETIASKNVVIRTDLVPFTTKPENAGANTYLLIYSIIEEGRSYLITGFPVGQSFVDSALNKDKLGENKPITTQYNAFVDGVSGESLQGTRKVIAP